MAKGKLDKARGEYELLLKSIATVQGQIQTSNQQLMMIEGALQTLEKLHGYNRQEIVNELNGSSV